MRRSLVLICGVLLALVVPASANATISSVFNDAASPLTCTEQVPSGYRYCGTTTNTTIPSFDGTPIDVSVSFPAAPLVGNDGNFPLVGIYHGWAGSKTLPSATATTRWLAQGYAVISVTDRGWGASCGGPSSTVKASPCDKGYIHLMSNASEVRDAQTLMGMLADDGVINPTAIGAVGGSYGGAISAQLASLKDRVQMPDNTLVAWESPVDEIPMSIAAALPEYTWSNLPQALMPNGSGFDYVADSPYKGPNGDHRIGTDKQSWTNTLNFAGTLLGYYAPTTGAGFPDPTANMIRWFQVLSTGGPYDNNPEADAMLEELENNHSAYGIDDSTTAPAPMLLSSGWNDDLFPVNEALRTYNKVRTNHPTTPVQLYGLDYGHAPRSVATSGPDAAAFGADYAPLVAAQNAWFARYVRGDGLTPSNAVGGVTITTSKCVGTGRVAGETQSASKWAQLAVGDVIFQGSAEQTIFPSTNPASPFTSGTVCANSAEGTEDTGAAAVYESEVASGGGYTIAGSPAVDATFTVSGANDQIIARLYDVDTGADTEKLISRGVYRPLSHNGTDSRETFQLYAQAWDVEDGHKLKLELLSADSQYMRTAAGVPQQAIKVKNLTVHVPTTNDPGDADGQVAELQPRTLAPGYELTQDALNSDQLVPVTSDDVDGSTKTTPVVVTLNPTDTGISGVDKTYYTVGANPVIPTTTSSVYDPNNKPTLQNGERISYFSVDRSGNTEDPQISLAASVVPAVAPAPVVPLPFIAPTKLSVTVKTKGSIKVGKTVKLTLGTKAAGAKIGDVKYAYKWTSGKKTLGKKSSLKLKSSWKGKKITVRVRATKAGFTMGSKTITVTRKLK